MNISHLDWIVFFLVLLVTLASITYGNLRKKKSQDGFLDYLLMGRRLTLPFFVMTLVSTWYGGIFGVTQIAFESGIYNFITQGVFWYVTYIFFALFMVEKIRKTSAITLPEMVEKNLGPFSGRVASVLNFTNLLPIAYVVSLGLFIQMFSGLSLTGSTTFGALFVIAYSTFGGFRAVVFSDIIQFFVMCIAVAMVILFSYRNFGGIEFLQGQLPVHYFSPMGNANWGETILWGFIALSTLVDPNFYHRCFAAESTKTAKRGILLSTGVWLLFDLCTTFGAMYAAANMPEADSSRAYFDYALSILPSGLRGLFLAGILATILSTLDSYLFLASATFQVDILRQRSVGALKISHLLIGVLSVGLSFLFEGNIKNVWKFIGGYSSAALLVPIALCTLIPSYKLTDRQFSTIVLSSCFTMTSTKIFINSQFSELSFYVGLVTSFVLWLFFTKKGDLSRSKT